MRLYFISSGVNSERTKKLLSCFCCCHWSFLIDWLNWIDFFFQSNNSIYWVYIKKMDDIKIDGIYDFDSINNKQIALGIADCISNWSKHQIVTCLGEEQSSTGEGPRPDEVEGWSTSKIVLQSSILMLKGSSNLWSSLAFLKK